MAGKGATKNVLTSSQPIRKEPKKLNAKTMCKLDHLKNIAEWAALESSISPLAAFFGQRVAATNEELGLRNDPSSFLCERCETILEPGNNCTIRIEKNKSKRRNRRKKSNNITQNCVVYNCHFCSHRNLMRGTVKGYVKEICPGDGKDVETCMPATPVLLLDANKRKRNRSSVKKGGAESSAVVEDKGVQSSSKRRKKSWTSLKQIVESHEQESMKKLPSLTVPFFI